jgi:ATP-dependent RNA helicase RhlE
MSFHTLGLSNEILNAIKDQGYSTPTKVQERVIPSILKNLDILGISQTGTGKSAAFILPTLQKLIKIKKSLHVKHPYALILAPTKELALQLENAIKRYSKYLDIDTLLLIGGKNINAQQSALKNENVDIVIATPGRLKDHIILKNIVMNKIEIAIFDEADTLLDMGFLEEIDLIIQNLPQKRQNLLFSATKSDALMSLSHKILRSNERVEIDSKVKLSQKLTQSAFSVDKEKKCELLAYIIGRENFTQSLVFASTKAEVENIKSELNLSGLKCDSIHGDKKQGARKKILQNFIDKDIRVLVATDIAARGIDIESLDAVINYDLPQSPQEYIHRVGRTARAGRDGIAISLVSFEEREIYEDIQKFIKTKIPLHVEDGFEPINISKRREIERKKVSSVHKKTDGAFGNKKKNKNNKKRKSTKRDFRY